MHAHAIEPLCFQPQDSLEIPYPNFGQESSTYQVFLGSRKAHQRRSSDDQNRDVVRIRCHRMPHFSKSLLDQALSLRRVSTFFGTVRQTNKAGPVPSVRKRILGCLEKSVLAQLHGPVHGGLVPLETPRVEVGLNFVSKIRHMVSNFGLRIRKEANQLQ